MTHHSPKITTLALAGLLAGCGTIDASAETQEALVAFCAPSTTPPAIYDAQVTEPTVISASSTPPSGFDPRYAVLQRGSIHYVSDTYFVSEIEIHACGYIKEVRFGSRVLTTSYVDGYFYNAYLTPTQPADTTRARYRVYIRFAKQGNGETFPVSIVVGRAASSVTSTHTFTISSVNKVHPSLSLTSSSVSDMELKNAFAHGVFNAFNQPGHVDELIVDGKRAYDLDHDSITMFADSGVINFSFRFKGDIPDISSHACDPTMSVGGAFRVGVDALGVFPIWVVEPQTGEDFPAACEAVTLIPGLGALVWFIVDLVMDTSAISASVKTAIEEQFASFLTGALLIDSVTVGTKQLFVNARLPFASVEIKVPYGPFGHAGRTGMTLGAGETVTLLGSGLGVNQLHLWSGPNGLPNLFGMAPPVLDEGFVRSAPDDLPWPGRNVGAAIGTLGLTRLFYVPGCKLVSPYSTPTKLLFGVNDTPADAAALASGHTFNMTVGFPGGDAGLFEACPSQTGVVAVQR